MNALIAESAIEFSMIALVGLSAAALLRRRSAALRHVILSTSVACAAVAPVLGVISPSWQLPRAAAPPPITADAGNARIVTDAGAAATSATSPSAGADAAPIAEVVVPAAAAVWIAGAAMNLGLLLTGMWRLSRVRQRARPVLNAEWTRLAADICRTHGIRKVLLLESDHPALLVTWGISPPKVILPTAAQQWPTDRVRVVLAHELAHVQRGDWLVQVAAEILRSIHWFNPLAWLLCSRLRHDSEQAADDAVLRAGVDGHAYAEHLLDIARAIRLRGHAWGAAPAIVRTSTLERRITAMLNRRLNRTPPTRLARLASVAALFAVTVAIASAQTALGRFSGAVLDPMNRTLPNAELILTNVKTQDTHRVKSDHTGQFEFSELPHGDYALEVEYPGFMVLKGQVTIAANNVQQTLSLDVGTLRETITVKAGPAAPDPEQDRIRDHQRRSLPPRANDCNATPHGGNLRPPMKLTDVRPEYPLHLANANVAGTVLMKAVIAKDGTMKEVNVTGSAHPDLDAAAVKAVRQWRFDSTLLNCMPIEVNMTVTVNFTVD